MCGLLVRLRKEAGLNQAALAARLRITQSQVSKYERGERLIDEVRLRAWLSALGKPIEALACSLPRPAEAAQPGSLSRAEAQVERNEPGPRSGPASSFGSTIQSST